MRRAQWCGGMRTPIAAVALLMLCVSQGVRAHVDACQEQIPQALTSALARTYPGYRTPLEYDNAPEDIARQRARGATGCLGVGAGAFTGDGKKDYVVGLTARKGGAGLAVLAFPKKGGWQFKMLQVWPDGARAASFVEAVAPGQYGQAPALDCPNGGAHVGALGGAATLFCYFDGRWHSIALADQ